MSKDFIILNKQKGQIINWPAFRKMLEGLKDGKHLVEISGADKRSNPMNKYYWMMLTNYVQPGLRDAGWQYVKTKEDAHVFVTDLFLKVKEVNKETGEIKERIRSTTELTKLEMKTYFEEIWQWGSEYLGIYIPEPNEQTILSYE